MYMTELGILELSYIHSQYFDCHVLIAYLINILKLPSLYRVWSSLTGVDTFILQTQLLFTY